MDNQDLREAVMLVYDEYGEIEEVYVFEDHNDAIDIWDDLKTAKKKFYMGAVPVTHYKQGEKPDILQQPRLL